ncbi:hypothetical protein VTK56DRAFT_1255 [Thermocarpiscus australiensis]
MSLSPEQLAALLAAPALEPPLGVTADFDNLPNQNGLAWFVTTFCMGDPGGRDLDNVGICWEHTGINWQKKIGISVIFSVRLLASISGSVGLATTVTFAYATNTMYFIALLLFWACAEMTCGFFILCVLCLPSIVKESGLSGRIKKFSASVRAPPTSPRTTTLSHLAVPALRRPTRNPRLGKA